MIEKSKKVSARQRRKNRKYFARMQNEAEAKGIWKRHTPYHWATWIDGKKLDYWPGPRKFMFRGVVQVGNVQEFIKSITKK